MFVADKTVSLLVSGIRWRQLRGGNQPAAIQGFRQRKALTRTRTILKATGNQSDSWQPAKVESSQSKPASAGRSWKWSVATVIENRADSADGTLRTLVLSIEDHVNFIDGRKVRRRQEAPRWIDSYKVPGQYIGVYYQPDHQPTAVDAPHRMCAISSSPYDSRRDSAFLDASLIEILVDRTGDSFEGSLSELGPGALLQVSQVVGQGFSSLFSTTVGLQSALEDQRSLIMLALGPRGMAPLRAVLQWTPVLAHATQHPVSLFYAASCPAAAAYLKEWDKWRDAGVRVYPCYLDPMGDGNGGAKYGIQDMEVLLDSAVFGGEHGLKGSVGGELAECAVLMAGLSGELAAHLTRKLTAQGVPSERLLICDYAF